MIVDDVFVRIGSANCSHRSMGMDSECDVAVEAGGSAAVREGIRRIRDRMLAEHLDMQPGAVNREIERAGSLGALIDARAQGDRTLVAIETPPETADGAPNLVKAAADPDEPLSVGAVDYLIPAVDAARGRAPLRIWILPLVIVLAAGAVAWTSSGIDVVPAVPIPAWLGVAGFLAAGLVLVPLEVLAIAAGVMCGATRGAGVALAGSFLAAAAGYWIGRAVGPARLGSWLSRRSYRSIRQLGSRSVSGVVALHLAAVASAGAIHLLSGAGRVPFLTYLGGTSIGLVPGVVALSGLGGLLRRTLLDPSITNASITIGAALVLLLFVAALRAVLLHPPVRALGVRSPRPGGVRVMASLPMTLRVATYNVHACVGTDGRHDPERVASVIDELQADVVALQEFTYPATVAIETRRPVGFATLGQYRVRARPDAAEHHAVLRERASHAPSDRRGASARPLDRAARAARRAGRHARRGRPATARAGGTSRPARPRAAVPGPPDSRLSRVGAADAVRRAGRFQRLAAWTFGRARPRPAARAAASSGLVSGHVAGRAAGPHLGPSVCEASARVRACHAGLARRVGPPAGGRRHRRGMNQDTAYCGAHACARGLSRSSASGLP